ncbi:hypothetical protein Q5M48_00280 [Acinetobacter nosocomialis]|uniref:hypothetical protein n=1 Tax=Acinetobacter nosocomialis TaxID=106654 RepID=UPI0026F25489|nr:hypothetical protein [Acinetobacter nosocomialis]MDO7206627.1 hypothetical protein [Acinetobacter nosocomialis]
MSLVTESDDTHYKVKIEMFETHHNYLSAIMLNQAEQAKKEEVGHKFRWIIPAMSFAVFNVESVCNLYGSQLIKNWQLLESASFLGKVSLVSEHLGLEVDWSKEPWQTINKMKNFRNALVHLKPKKTAPEYTYVKKTVDIKRIHRYALLINGYPKTKNNIMSYSNLETMEKFITAASDLEGMWMWKCQDKEINVYHHTTPITEIMNPSAINEESEHI